MHEEPESINTKLQELTTAITQLTEVQKHTTKYLQNLTKAVNGLETKIKKLDLMLTDHLSRVDIWQTDFENFKNSWKKISNYTQKESITTKKNLFRIYEEFTNIANDININLEYINSYLSALYSSPPLVATPPPPYRSLTEDYPSSDRPTPRCLYL